jgi:transposase-like protein
MGLFARAFFPSSDTTEPLGGRISTFDSRSEGVLEALVAGVSIEDTARQHRIASRTIDRWLARGRRDPESKYGPFAEAVDLARAERELPQVPKVLRLDVRFALTWRGRA